MKQIITNIASTIALAPLAYGNMSISSQIASNSAAAKAQHFEIMQTEIKMPRITTQITKYYLTNGLEENFFGQLEAKFLRFVNHFSQNQIELEEDFVASLNRLEEKTRNPFPKKNRF